MIVLGESSSLDENLKNKKIFVRGFEYQLLFEDGKECLLRFNRKHKMWVKCRFSDVSHDNTVIEVLSRQFIEAHTNK